jgi:adenylate cyclase
MLCGFLSHIVNETLAGRAHEIKGYTVATQAFGRRKDFDPTIDPIVRIQAGRLRRILESYYSGRGRHNQLRIVIGKGSYVPTFSRLITEKPRTEQSEQPTGMLPAEEPTQQPAEVIPLPNGSGPSVAVMPVVNLTNDPDKDYLADGLTEELMSELARCHGLEMNASQSTMQWKGKQIGASQAGLKLGVRFFLEGSLRTEGHTVKFSLRLIDTATLLQIWGEQYKRDLRRDRVIDLQEEIARNVAGRIGGLFGAIPQKLSKESRSKALGTLETYEAFLRFCQYLIELTPRAHAQALESLEYVQVRDPESGVTLSMLAGLYANEYAFFYPKTAGMIEKAIALARKGVALEPENLLARTLLAYVLFLSGQKELFFREAEQSLLLNPNSPELIAFHGWAMALYGDWERGLLLLEQGMGWNPFHPGWFHLVPYLNYYRHGKFEEAYHEAEKFNAPQLFWDSLVRAAALGQLERGCEAKVAVNELLTIKPDFPTCGQKLIGFFVKDPKLVQILFEGLRKAGLEA